MSREETEKENSVIHIGLSEFERSFWTDFFAWRKRKNQEEEEKVKDLTIDQVREAIEELEKTDPLGAEFLKHKLLTGVVEG